MKKKNKFISLFAIFIIVMLPTTAFANSLSQEVSLEKSLENQTNQIDQQISNETQQETTIKTQIQSYNVSLSNVSNAISQNEAQSAQIQLKINQLNQQIETNNQKLQTLKTNLGNVMQDIYNKGTGQYIQFLINSTSFYNLIQRIGNLQDMTNKMYQMSQQINQLTQELSAQKQQQTANYTALQNKKTQLLSLQGTYQNLVNQKQIALQNVQKNISNNQNQKTILESKIKLTKQQIAVIHQQMIEAEKLAQSKKYVQQQQQNLVPANVQNMIQYAESYEGLPYVWGGTTPNPGFDCSGFTQYVFRHFGINIPRTAEEQFLVGVPVSHNNLQPGDLVFFTTYAPGASHVGIYIGNGMMIDSEDLGVVIDNINNSYWAPKYLGARQYIK